MYAPPTLTLDLLPKAGISTDAVSSIMTFFCILTIKVYQVSCATFHFPVIVYFFLSFPFFFLSYLQMKPDTIDIPTQKPDTIDEPVIYDKPNTYDDDDNTNNDNNNSQSLPQEVLDDLIIRSDFVDGKRPDIQLDDDEPHKRPSITSSLLSHVPLPTSGLTATTSTTSLTPPHVPIASQSASSISSIGSDKSTASTRMALMQILKKKPMEDLIKYDLRKVSLTRPEEQDVYFHGTKVRAYRKVQPHSYSWGFQNILYRVLEDSENVKVAETRRRAFKKEITIEWGDFPIYAIDEEPPTPDSSNSEDGATRSRQLHNITKSHLLFTYETEFEGHLIRWKRASLLSHDMVCEVKHGDKWRVIAEFDSHRMGYFIHLGELIIDRNALQIVEKPHQFEAHIIVLCCTLIDLMREVVEQAVGISKGGIVNSDK